MPNGRHHLQNITTEFCWATRFKLERETLRRFSPRTLWTQPRCRSCCTTWPWAPHIMFEWWLTIVLDLVHTPTSCLWRWIQRMLLLPRVHIPVERHQRRRGRVYCNRHGSWYSSPWFSSLHWHLSCPVRGTSGRSICWPRNWDIWQVSEGIKELERQFQ